MIATPECRCRYTDDREYHNHGIDAFSSLDCCKDSARNTNDRGEDKGHACQLYGYLKAAEQRIGNNLLGEIGGTEIQMDGAFYKIQILYIVWQIQTELLTHFGDSLGSARFSNIRATGSPGTT